MLTELMCIEALHKRVSNLETILDDLIKKVKPIPSSPATTWQDRLVREYNDKAREIIENWDYKEENKRQDVNNLLKEFLSKVLDIPEDRLWVF